MKAEIVFLLCTVIFHGGFSRKLPDFVKPCNRNTTDQSKCVIETIQLMRQELIKGIPEMGVPSMDPLHLPRLELSTGGGNSNFGYDSNLTDLIFLGGKDFQIRKADVSFERKIFAIDMFVPVFYVTGHYEGKGRVLVLQFDSEGQLRSNFTDVLISGRWKANPFVKKGKEYFKFDAEDVQVNVGKISTIFENLFRNNPELTDNTNRILNENSDVLYDEIKPVIGKGISELITAVLNTVHERYSVDVLYPV